MELKNKGIIIRILIKLSFFILLQFIFISCKLNIPTNPGEIIFLMNDIRKLGLITSSSEANITISGTLKDSAGNIIPGGILEISRLGSANIIAKATADSKVYADINGKFSMNIYVDSFNIKVSRSDGSFVGSFALKVTSATDPPEVLTSTGLQVSGLAATPSTGGTILEPLKVVFTGLPQVINEGQSVTVQVRLSRAMSSNLSVNLSLNNSAITIDGISSKSLSFSSDSSTTNQSITLAAVGDINTISETVVLTVQANGIEDISYSLTALDTTVSAPVISVSNVPSNINEGNSISIGIKLTGNVTQAYSLSLSSSNSNSISVSPSTLTFTTSNFSVDQQVTLTALQDENLVSESVTIILAATGLNQVSFSVNATDDDTQNILISGNNSLNEGGSGSVSVKLSKQPPSNVTVNLSSSNPTSLSLGSSVLTFTPTNYSTNQTVAVNALQDDNQTSETVVVTATATGVSLASWNIVCIDDDTTIVLSGNNSVNEGGTITLGITLSGNPGTSRTVSFSSGNTNSITVSPSSMIFTTSNYGSSQALTVTGVEDTNVIAEAITITASGTGLVSSSKVVNTVENDTMNITLGGTTTVNEGSTASMTVVLTQDPSGSLTVNLNSGDPSITVSPASLTFTSANYSTIQNVTLTGVEDLNESSETVTISTSATGVATQTRSVVAIDNDIKPVFTGASSVNEGGTASISITLSGNPGTSRTVNLSSNNIYSVTLTPVELTFTPANWNSAQTVNLTGVQDLNALGESVTLTASGAGLVTATKSITVVDDETQSIILAGSGSTIDEGTSSVTISVKLAYDPVNAYQVNLASSNTGSVTVSPSSLTFTTANYSTNQTVTLTGVEDANQTSESITITASGAGVSNQTLSYTTIENDTTIVFGNPSGYEGSTVTVPITLSGNPGVSRTVSFSSNTNPPTISSGTLSFTTSNFSTPQNLTLSGVTDTTTSVITASGSGLVSSNWNASTAKYSIGGSVSGLTGNLELLNKGSFDNMTLTGNGNFSFSKASSNYIVTAKYYIFGKICLIANATGIANSSINNININCTNKSYTLGEGGSGLLSTGQVTSIVSGDDGYYQSTLKRSYTDVGDGTITDNVTGLSYQKCSAGQSNNSTCSGTSVTYTWVNASSYCNSLSLSGKTWRLPSLNEQINLVRYVNSLPTIIDNDIFPNNPSNYYWSSNIYARDTLNSWSIDFTDGAVDYMRKTYAFNVRCVSGQQTSKSFTDNSNGTVSDNATGLIWQKCSAGQGSTLGDCTTGSAITNNWENAIIYCEGLSLGGSTDWRLPNINELRSIVDYSKTSTPTINITFFPSSISNRYWSSSTYAQSTNSAWVISFSTGSITGLSNTKTSNNYIRCVTGP